MTDKTAGKVAGKTTKTTAKPSAKKPIVKGTKKASGGNNLKINSNAKNYLANSEGFVRKGGQGVKGGHNIDSFYGELNAQGFNIDDCIINKKAHPTIKGIYEIEYKIPVMDNKGNIIPNQYKNIGQPKTVYDPKYFSDSTVYNLGVEAMQNGKISGREISFQYIQNRKERTTKCII